MVTDGKPDSDATDIPEITLVLYRKQIQVLVLAAALGAIGITDRIEKEQLRTLLGKLQEVLDATA